MLAKRLGNDLGRFLAKSWLPSRRLPRSEANRSESIAPEHGHGAG
jgi:hypothetical protein